MTKDRLQREAQFHDGMFADDDAYARVAKFYAVAGTAIRDYRQLVVSNCAGRRVLEYGCGKGSLAFELARGGADVTGIDISTEAIRQAMARARAEGLADNNIAFQVMNAEEMDFLDNHFDLVCGSGILHHLDIGRALRELARVLKPTGRAVFFEPLGHNPFINLYRQLTPAIRSEDEHPLLTQDIETLVGQFHQAHISYHVLCALAVAPLIRWPRIGRGLLGLLERLDAILLRFPVIQRQAWMAVIVLERPRKPSSEGNS